MAEPGAQTPEPTRLPVSEQVLAIVRRLEEAGYETWCVGGAIRDALRGDPQQDVDLATAAPPEVVRSLFRRTIPVGIEHGTVGVLDTEGVLHEVTTFRRDVVSDGRHAVVAFGVSLEEDLARRDFTINAIAYHPLHHRFADPFDGRADLLAGVVRAVGDPAARFREDRLRILRALRFAARLGFAIDGPTWDAAVSQSGEIDHLSAERVRDEWVKGLKSAVDVNRLVELWQRSGVASTWLPEVHGEGSVPELPVFGRDPVLLTAALCAPSATVWRRLKSSTAELRRAEAIDRGPSAPQSDDAIAVRRWMARVGPAAKDFATLAAWQDEGSTWRATMAEVEFRGDPVTRGALAVTGNDLMESGVVPAGPRLGLVLEALLDAVLEDPARNTRETLLALATRLATSPGGGASA